MTQRFTPTDDGYEIAFDCGTVVRVAGGLRELEEFMDWLDNTPPKLRGEAKQRASIDRKVEASEPVSS